MLRGALPRGVGVFCYADDILLVAAGEDGASARRLAVCGTTLLVRRIEELGLQVALSKTEAIWLHGPRKRPAAEESTLRITNVAITIGATMGYLGLELDSRWQFGPHFQRALPKALRVANAMARLLTNVKGPGDGAPIWCEALARSRVILALVRQTQRTISARVARAYRTVACETACALAGTVPRDIVAGAQTTAYRWRCDLREKGIQPTPAARARRRAYDLSYSRIRWKERLEGAEHGRRVAEAIGPVCCSG